MNQIARATLNDVQSAILGHICEKLNGDEWITIYGDLCNTIKCHDEKLIKNALELLIKEDKIILYKYIDIKPVYYKLGQDLNKFLSIGQFRIRLEAEGRKAYEERNKKQFRNLGSPAANQVVRDTITQLSPILTLDVSRPEFAQMCIRILEELVRVGVRNYQDNNYLRKPAQAYLKAPSGKDRRDCEVGFYQPFLRTELQRDKLLAGRIPADVTIAGGTTDILTICQIPIEAKVIYPDDKSEDNILMDKGVAQAAQYASLSRVAFLSVLDLRPRNTIADLSNIQNDVKVIPLLQKEGNHDVKVVRVQHICGYGVPSEVRR
ncbi:MAG: hypothetical protein HY607_06390 [Planctomycetes bacterium]|nr:hypothetical protein [Planctomycetota bacterium]MBI4222292.1 hypothetical protein [Planctomycetota bacterium]